jgi:DNA adenine methylase
MLPKLIPYWSDCFSRYFEPFVGSGALFFAVGPSRAVLSDINVELVETLCSVRDHPRAIHNRLIAFSLGKESYYMIRDYNPANLSKLDRAARFIYLNRFCFNGLYRTNKMGRFNVPFAAAKTGDLPSYNDLKFASISLSGADIIASDFEPILNMVKPGDFIYLDPPYAVNNRRIFRQYGPACFGLSDLKRLSGLLPYMDNIGAHFLVSYALCEESLDAFKGWYITRSLSE